MCTSTARSRYAMTSTAAERIAIVGTGLIGTSIAMASTRVGCEVAGWDLDARSLALAAGRAPLRSAPTLEDAVAGADIVVVCAPVPSIPELVARALAAAPAAVVTDAGSIKDHVVREVGVLAGAGAAGRFVGGHPMGGSERSGPEHASASVVDGIVWVLTPGEETEAEAVAELEAWIERIGGRPVRMSPARHDRLVAFVSHLPQVASTALMGLAATEEADEPDILLLAAGVPRSHASGLVQSGAVEPDPAVEPRGDRRGDRPVLGPPGRPPRDGSGRSRTRRRGDLRRCQAGAAASGRQAAGAGRRGGAPGSGARPSRRPRGAHVRARGAFREHRGPPDRPLARGRAGDRAPHRCRDIGRRRAPVCSRRGRSTRSVWPEDERCASE